MPSSIRKKPAFYTEIMMRGLRIGVDYDEIQSHSGEEEIEYLFEMLFLPHFHVFLFSNGDIPPDLFQPSLMKLSDAEKLFLSSTPMRSECDIVHRRESPRFTGDDSLPGDERILQINHPTNQGLLESYGGLNACTDSMELLLLAESRNVDILISYDAFLSNPPWSIPSSTCVISPEQAVPLLGLFLRSQNYFFLKGHRLGASDDIHAVGSDLSRDFYWPSASDILPNAKRWRLSESDRDDHEELVGLANAILQRATWVLQNRDRVLALLSVSHDIGSGEEILSEVLQITLWLLGAVDAAAVIAHRVFDLAGGERNASWQNGEWINSLRNEGGEPVAKLVEEGSRGELVLSILREVRNTIHGMPPSLVLFVQNEENANLAISLPKSRNKSILKAVVNFEVPEIWGFFKSTDGQLLMHPGMFVEVMIPSVFELIDSLLDKMWNADLAKASARPQQSPDSGFSLTPMGKRRRLWQLGMGPAALVRSRDNDFKIK